MKSTTLFALQSQETRLSECVLYAAGVQTKHTGLSPSVMPYSKGPMPCPHASNTSYTVQRAKVRRPRALQYELFPLHSPLLRESLLVSFPPLNYMLKFSGSPYFIWHLWYINVSVDTQAYRMIYTWYMVSWRHLLIVSNDSLPQQVDAHIRIYAPFERDTSRNSRPTPLRMHSNEENARFVWVR